MYVLLKWSVRPRVRAFQLFRGSRDVDCGTCSCSDSPDFIVVRDGPDAFSAVIAQYCNRQRSEQLMSSGRQLYVDFIVDGRRQSNGFEATYEFVGDDVDRPGPGVMPPTVSVQSPILLQQQSEGHRQADNELVARYRAGTCTSPIKNSPHTLHRVWACPSITRRQSNDILTSLHGFSNIAMDGIDTVYRRSRGVLSFKEK